MASRALITGINGFTGTHLAAELRNAGYDVYGLSHSSSADSRILQCDLMDRAQVASIIQEVRPQYVVHLAAIAFVAHGDAEAIYRTNVVGTRNLLEALTGLQTPPSSVLLASSANIYGNARAGELDETVAPDPVNDYAVSKLAMEYMAKLWLDQLPITIVRPFNYTGVGQPDKFVIPKIVSHYRSAASMIELGNIDVVRDFSDVRVVVRCYRQLMELAPVGELVNICSGNGTSLSQVLETMEAISGHRLKVTVNPAFVRANEVKTLIGSRQRLESIIGPVEDIPLADTLRWMYESSEEFVPVDTEV